MASILVGDYQVTGNFSAGTMALPSGSVTDTSVQANAKLAASKIVHDIVSRYQQNTTAAVVADNQFAHIVNGTTCTLAAVKAVVDTAATGADRTVTIDLQKRTGAGAFASVLTSTISFNNASVAGTVTSGAIATSTFSQNDYFKWVITVAGAAGNQAIGVLVEAHFQETSQ